MIYILTSFLFYLWNRTPERAACVVINLANFGMDREHVKQMAQYLTELEKDQAKIEGSKP